jgi:trk system potassium uptake protein TrkA
VAVIGLGRFGSALALELQALGHEVLGIDLDTDLVQQFAPLLTRTVTADSTNADAMRELGVDTFDRVVVAIGVDLEASILTVSLLKELGVPQVWAKAMSDSHGRILAQLAVDHVIFPEKDMGKRIAHSVGGDQLDYIEIDEGFAMAKTIAAPSFVGKSLTDLAIRREYGVIVVATASGDVNYLPATPATVIGEGEYLIVAGPKDKLEIFSRVQ